jgi:hypothetical protein
MCQCADEELEGNTPMLFAAQSAHRHIGTLAHWHIFIISLLQALKSAIEKCISLY